MSNQRIKLALCLTLVLFTATTARAEAYIDPGAGSLMWQMTVAALMGTLFYIRRIVGWVAKIVGRKDAATERGGDKVS